MNHRKGIDLVRDNSGYTIKDGSVGGGGGSEHTYRIEVWSAPPEDGGALLETISRATDFSVSMGAYRAALEVRAGKTLVHLNARHRMSCEVARMPPPPEQSRLRSHPQPVPR